MAYPTWKYHAVHGARLVQTAAEEALRASDEDGWTDSPAKVHLPPADTLTPARYVTPEDRQVPSWPEGPVIPGDLPTGPPPKSRRVTALRVPRVN